MRFFLDTEFTERGPHHPIRLISIGLVAESGEEYYAISSEFRTTDCNGWVQTNVLPQLTGERKLVRTIAEEVREFVQRVAGESKSEFWGYYSAYDWVLFAQLFGTMMDLPRGWPMLCLDLKQLAMSLGDPELPTQESVEHNALADARWNKQAWEFLRKVEVLICAEVTRG